MENRETYDKQRREKMREKVNDQDFLCWFFPLPPQKCRDLYMCVYVLLQRLRCSLESITILEEACTSFYTYTYIFYVVKDDYILQ